MNCDTIIPVNDCLSVEQEEIDCPEMGVHVYQGNRSSNNLVDDISPKVLSSRVLVQ